MCNYLKKGIHVHLSEKQSVFIYLQKNDGYLISIKPYVSLWFVRASTKHQRYPRSEMRHLHKQQKEQKQRSKNMYGMNIVKHKDIVSKRTKKLQI